MQKRLDLTHYRGFDRSVSVRSNRGCAIVFNKAFTPGWG